MIQSLLSEMPDWCEAEERCPITATSDIIGKLWTQSLFTDYCKIKS